MDVNDQKIVQNQQINQINKNQKTNMEKQNTKYLRLFTAEVDGKVHMAGMAITKDSPFANIQWFPDRKLLLVVSSSVKRGFQMENALDNLGAPKRISKSSFDAWVKKYNTQPPAYEQVRLETDINNEFPLSNRQEQEAFINEYCVNAADIDFKSILDAPLPEKQAQPAMEFIEGKPEVIGDPKKLTIVKE